MAGTGPEDLWTLSQSFLDACVDALDTIPVFAAGLVGAPSRAFVTYGQPAADCEQITVHVSAVTESPTGQTAGASSKSAKTLRTNMPTLVATLFRCIPTLDSNGNPPSVSSCIAASKQIEADGWVLWNHIYNLIRSDMLFSECGEVYWDGLRALQPQGEFGGWTLTVRVSLDGYEEAVGT